MRIAIINAISNDWAAAASLVEELGPALQNGSGLDPVIWLVCDGIPERFIGWSAFASSPSQVHLLELQGRQGGSRALATALGYLICERDEQFDAFVLLEDGRLSDARHVNALLENSDLHPGAVIFGKVEMSSQPWTRRLSRHCLQLLTRVLCGERLENSTLTFLPVSAAEALAHSCRAGSHLEGAIRQLGIPAICTKAARAAPRQISSLSMLEELSVFRERVFARAFTVTGLLFVISLLFALGLTALRLFSASAVSTGALALHWILPLLLGTLAAISLLLGLAAQALNESRRWTPALDCAVQVRSARRMKRGPESIAN